MHRSDTRLEWSDLQVLLAVGRAGSLSGAARSLGLNHSTVFRRVNAIEERTSVRFFDRLPTGYAMTEAGETALVHAERVESEIHDLGRKILGQDLRLQGPVRVTAPEGIAALVLPQLLTDFRREHPDVTLEVAGTARRLDLNRREAEVAIRATRKPPDNAIGRRVCKFRFGIYGAPAYVEACAGTPIQELDWTFLTGIADWIVPQVFRRRRDVDAHTVFHSESLFAVTNATAAGAGVTLLPMYVGGPDDRLVMVGEPLPHLVLDLWVLTHPDLRNTVRVKALMDHLYEGLGAMRERFEGPG